MSFIFMQGAWVYTSAPQIILELGWAEQSVLEHDL